MSVTEEKSEMGKGLVITWAMGFGKEGKERRVPLNAKSRPREKNNLIYIV